MASGEVLRRSVKGLSEAEFRERLRAGGARRELAVGCGGGGGGGRAWGGVLRRSVKGLSEAEFRERFGTEEACRAALFAMRRPEGLNLPGLRRPPAARAPEPP